MDQRPTVDAVPAAFHTEQLDSDTNNDFDPAQQPAAAERERPRTAPPTNGWGEQMDRYEGSLSAPCDGCDGQSLDLWLVEGATSAKAVCPSCKHEHDDERVRELYEIANDSEVGA